MVWFKKIQVSRLVVISIFLLVSFSFILFQRTHKLRIFVLHSYNARMQWVKGLEAGMAQVFDKRHYIDMRYFYMNTKIRHSQSYLKRISREAYNAIKRFKPDIIIVYDTNAQQLVATKLANHPKYKVVVAGVTGSDDLIKFIQANNITGVLEAIPVKAIRETLSLMLPKSNRIFYLSDNSVTAQQLDKEVPVANWGRFQLIAHKRAATFAEWKHAVSMAQSTADVILISTYQIVSKNGKRVPPKKLIAWTMAHSKIPVIGVYESFINDGGYLAISVASYEQGYTAAKIALYVLEKKTAITEIPFIKSQMFQLQMRKHQVLKHYPGVVIPVILEAFSKTKWQVEDLSIKGLPDKV